MSSITLLKTHTGPKKMLGTGIYFFNYGMIISIGSMYGIYVYTYIWSIFTTNCIPVLKDGPLSLFPKNPSSFCGSYWGEPYSNFGNRFLGFSSYPRDPIAHLLRMVSWNRNTMRVVSVIGQPKPSLSDNMTRCVGRRDGKPYPYHTWMVCIYLLIYHKNQPFM